MKIEIKEGPAHEAGRLFGESASVTQELDYLCEAYDQSGNTYDLYIGKITQAPVVHSRKSGKYYLLPWPYIIKMAVAAGVDAV